MNKIKDAIFKAMVDVPLTYAGSDLILDTDEMSKAAAKIAIEWVEKAIDETKGYYIDREYVTGKSKEDFMKENGLLDD